MSSRANHGSPKLCKDVTYMMIGVVLKLNAGPNWAKSQKTVQLPPNDFGSVSCSIIIHWRPIVLTQRLNVRERRTKRSIVWAE
ncbi:unnamed protein product [Prunus brigantina]